MKLVIKQTTSEAHTKVGYSPIITFNVPHFDTTMEKLKVYGDTIEFDGAPRITDTYKLACVKSPDGLMMGILESTLTIDEENFNVDQNEDNKMDANSSEIKILLEKMKI